MALSFIHDVTPQRVVFARGAVTRAGEEAERLKLARALVIATPGSGQRLGARIAELLGPRSAGLHARAVIHVPRAVAQAGLAAAQAAKADGLVAVGGGAAIGLAKAIALETRLPILAIPTTYSGSEATPIYGTSEGERKFTGRDPAVVPRTIIYDPDLTAGLPAAVSAASGMNAIAHCVEGFWASDRTPVTVAMASEAMRRFGKNLPRVVADGKDMDAREECLVASWLAGIVLTAGTALHHKLAHVLGGLGLPHAETHAIILPHVTGFYLETATEARDRLAQALGTPDPAAAIAAMLRGFPIPQRLREVGLAADKLDFVAGEVGKMALKEPRPVSVAQARAILDAAY
ncbi:MAG TPA: maleylacetate reductase [Pseudolabrys sp.]|nr:maleylacetate reductase [Pseudolabrys sp.]